MSLLLNGLLRLVITIGFFPLVLAQNSYQKFVPVAPQSMSSTFVRSIFKDVNGYMWFGTGNGLVRYDGTNTYWYMNDPSNKKSIPNNRINTISEDKSHDLWIGTSEGLVKYDRVKDNFINVDSIPANTNHLNNQYITSIQFDLIGRVWIGTMGHGLSIYSPGEFQFKHIVNKIGDDFILSSNYITSIELIDNLMWVGTKGGLRLFNAQDFKEVALPFYNETLAKAEITQIVKGTEGVIWVSTSARQVFKLVNAFESYTITLSSISSLAVGDNSGNILAICPDDKGNLWLGGENTGLSYLDTKTNEIVRYSSEAGYPNKIPANGVRDIYIDADGIMWVGTFSNGAYLLDHKAKKFEIFQKDQINKPGLTSNNVRGLEEDYEGNIWVACDGGGLSKIDIETNKIDNLKSINQRLGTPYLYALLFDDEDNLWIGSWGKGIFRLNIKTNDIKNYKLQSSGFGDNKVFCIHQDREGKIWVGSVGSGLFFLDKHQDQFVVLEERNKTDHISKTTYISSIYDDIQGNLWVATFFGLYKLTKTENHEFDYTRYLKGNVDPGFGSNEIQTIMENNDKKLWFGTTDNGITLLSPQDPKTQIFNKSNGLPSNTIRKILLDNNQDVWISSTKGLTKYISNSKTLKNYTVVDGLPTNEFNLNSGLVARNGKVYFGSSNGLIAFYPDSISERAISPAVYLSDLRLDNKSVVVDGEDSPLKQHISWTKKIELNYDQRSFALDFVALNYGQSSIERYCYKLENFDNDWNCTNNNLTATYTNIDPGRYVFLVKAYTNEGFESDAPAKLEIVIRQAPWKTAWAILGYVLIATLIIYIFLRIRIVRIKFKNQLELERLAREKEHELSESKTQFFNNISHEFRTPLSLIITPLESLSAMSELPESARQRLEVIQSSSNKMLRLVNELMDFTKLENVKLKLKVEQGELVRFIIDKTTEFKEIAKTRDIHFGVHSMIRSLDGWFDHDKLEKIITNVLSNAFKFTTNNGQINVVLNVKESAQLLDGRISKSLEIVVIDNGIGIAPEELPFIFDKFYQAKSSTKIANAGTGIGLALTKGLVELHYGNIEAESKPDHETRFTILIPIERHIFQEDDIYESLGYITSPKELTPESNNDESELNYEAENDKPVILIVEDNEELRKYIAIEFKVQFTVLEARDGVEGLKLALNRTPDLIVSDVLMPNKNGIELCREVKSNVRTSHIPFILLTARTTVDDHVSGIVSGADVYITKPFSIRFLIAQVNQIIESRRKLYSRFSNDVYLLPSKVTGNEIDQAFLNKAINYIVENIQDSQLGVESISELFSLSRMQVYRKIKALTGKSVVDFIRVVRVKEALRLMELQKHTLSEIAYLTGFNSASYFTRCFKEQYGKAPSEYMEKNALSKS